MAQAIISRRGGAVKGKPPENWTVLQTFTSDAVWTCAAAGWYRIFCVGKSGDGGSGGGSHPNIESASGGAGSGGNSGAAAVSTLYIKEGEQHAITVTTALTSFGDALTAEAGANGDAGGYKGSTAGTNYIGSPGMPSTTVASAYGGNLLNASGFQGGSGRGYNGTSHVYAVPGGNNGGASGNGSGGGGGARLPTASPMDAFVIDAGTSYLYGGGNGFGSTRNGGGYKVWSSPNIELTGAGGGGGGGISGQYTSEYTPPGGGGTGMPGVVIIQRGVY